MKLKNRITGEINIIKVDEDYFKIYQDDGDFVCPVTLKELNDGWEDYEPKSFYYINENGGVLHYIPSDPEGEDETYIKYQKEIGNYFDTREEAEKAVEKLKAWKRLKDKGFRFEGWDNTDRSTIHHFSLFVSIEDLDNINKDLDICFGGEE